ncbi:MAG: poly-beta-hydroxybutyrate polymerase [Thiotrichales bacterium SG8_50]|nr:MAG: poly-beta-hydroxybutyrate polymerase [Thiotrichales bacterium SG8_50]
MLPVQMSPDQIMEELNSLTRKLSHGLQNLMEVGEITTGVTPKQAVYGEDKMVLYQFEPQSDKAQSSIPTLIVYALVNRPYMADLQENRSMIRGLLEAGQDVYLIDWGYPDRADRYLTLDDYINGYIDRCVDVICRKHRVDKVNLLGICQGGTFSLCYAAMHPDKVQNLVTMVTPVDFHTPDNMLSRWAQRIDVDLLVDSLGNIPGDLLNWTFLTLKPYRLIGQKYLDMIDLLDDPKQVKNFLRMEKWIFDSPDQAGEAYRQFIKDFYQSNKLVKGGLRIGAHEVKLADVTMPVLNVYATEDHLVPPAASVVLKNHVGTKDYQEVTFRGGHIGIYVSGRAQKEVPPAIGEWLDARCA